MDRPLIAITVDCAHDPEDARSRGRLQLNWNYAECVQRAGGNPILITPLTDVAPLLPLIDGWLIPGGDDIDAKHFGEENHPKVGLQDPKRFESESNLYKSVDAELPIFGICYGAQFLNVKRGGSLVQHLPDVVDHEEHTKGTLQEYSLEPGSKLARIVGSEQAIGKSYHHQAVNRLGEGLRVNAHFSDGTVEGVEDPTHPFLVGVQWHPERTPEDPATLALFDTFIQQARSFRAKKANASSL